MIEWCRDDKLRLIIEFNCKPKPLMRYALPDMSSVEKKKIQKYPFLNTKDLEVTIRYEDTIHKFTVPKGYCWDGATIPSIFWHLIGSKTQPEFLIASMIHDVLCENHHYVNNNRYLSSIVFKSLLLEAGVSNIKANVMFFAVDNFQRLLWRKHK